MKIFLFIFFLLNTISYCEEITLDNLLDELTKNSYKTDIYILEKEKNEALEKFYKLDKYNGINSSLDIEYDDTEDIYKTVAHIEFGDLYIESKRNYNPKNDFIFGINKNIKNLIFSKNDSNTLKNDLKKESDKYIFLKNMEDEKISLINLYRDYKNIDETYIL